MSVELEGRNVFTKEETGVFETEVVECPNCLFEFASKHVLVDHEEFYECPLCTEADLEAEIKNYKTALEKIAYHISLSIGEKEDYEKTVYEFIDIAKRALGY